jgi:dihydroorotase/N-acyl-D-amino-acid deacylase
LKPESPNFFAAVEQRQVALNIELRNQNWADAAIDLMIAEQRQIFAIFLVMDEDNLRLQVRQPWVKFSTDASGGKDSSNLQSPVHPRSYGTFPRVLAKYAREEKLLTLEDAVRKMTGAVAARLGIQDRGVIREGCFADLVLFDPEKIQDHATFTDSHRYSTGISDVWVNGARVLKAGARTGATPGMFVKSRCAR